MKFVIAVDLEGMPGVVGMPDSGLLPETCPKEYEIAVTEAARCVNAAVRKLFELGATEVLVWDNHGSGAHLPLDRLDPRVSILRGPSVERWAGMDETFTGAFLFGYHAMAGTPDGILSHTYSSATIQHIAVNGVQVGEIAADAHLAAKRGVPILGVVSDEAGVAEAKRFLPWVETVATKRGISRNSAILVHPDRCVEMVEACVECALRRLPEMKLFFFDSPATVEYRFMRMEQANIQVQRGAQRIDGYTVSRTMDEFSLLV